MNSSGKLNRSSCLIILAAFLSCVTPPRGPATGDVKPAGYELRDGKIIQRVETSAGEVRVDGSVTHVYGGGDELYYLMGRGAADPLCYAGYRNFRTGVMSEALLFKSLRGKSVRRFLGRDGVVFLLLCAGGSPNAPCVLHRVELNSMKEKRLEGVHDIILAGGKPVLLAGSAGGITVNHNGFTVPITMGGAPRFGRIFDDRFVTVTSGPDSEMVDLAHMKNIYAWSSAEQFMIAGDHNLIVELLDSGGAPAEKMLFYKLFVDGRYSGRTTTGPAQQSRRCTLKLDENEYHIIRMERWELPAGKEDYVRVNNIAQPRPLRIYMPSNRLLKISVTRDGGKYSVKRAAVKEDRKEQTP